MANPFDFVNSISLSKEHLMEGGNDLNEKDYNPFLVNRALSYFPDTIFHAAAMDRSAHLGGRMQYEYYLAAVPKKKRFTKWGKARGSDEIEAVKKHFDYSTARAIEAMNILTEDQIKELVTLYTKGYGGTQKAK
jgi:hypothetical protein